jgi:hypothetical protein
MARYPVTVNIKKTPLPSAAKPMPKVKPVAPTMSKAATQATLGRAERIQREEAGESMLMKRKAPQVIRTTVNERTTPAKKK